MAKSNCIPVPSPPWDDSAGKEGRHSRVGPCRQAGVLPSAVDHPGVSQLNSGREGTQEQRAVVVGYCQSSLTDTDLSASPRHSRSLCGSSTAASGFMASYSEDKCHIQYLHTWCNSLSLDSESWDSV